jgi:midasin (ATPase involved in ribosome maturation)
MVTYTTSCVCDAALQDYIGSYLPAGDGTFAFHEGPLLRCARQGHWLLLDEFNLADPCVLSVLCPLLEGASSLSVPGGADQPVATDRRGPVHSSELQLV